MLISVVINLDETQLPQFGKTPEDVANEAQFAVEGILMSGGFIGRRGNATLDFETSTVIEAV